MHRSKKRAAKASGNISLHFNDLKQNESTIEDEEIVSRDSLVEETEPMNEAEKNNNRIDAEMNSKKILPVQELVEVVETSSVQQIVDPLMELPVSEEILIQDAKVFPSVAIKKGIEPSNTSELHHAKEEGNEHDISAEKSFTYFADSSKDKGDGDLLFPETSAPSLPVAAENAAPRSANTFSAKAHPTQSSQVVEDHPLAVQNSESSSEEGEFENETVAKQNRKVIKPVRPPPTYLLHDSNKQSVGMISSALFNPKARTKLFSTIKKNIQHYTGSTVAVAPQSKAFQYGRLAGSGSDFDTVQDDDMDDEAKAESQAGDIFSHLSFSADNSIIKGFRGKVVEPLQAMKRAWEDVPKEAPQNEPEIRKRSSSESNFSSAPLPRLEQRISLQHSEADDLSAPRSKTVSMTFSSLLAEKHKQIEDTVKSSGSRESQKTKCDVVKESVKLIGERIEELDIHDKREENYEASSDTVSVFGLLTLTCFVYTFLISPKPPFMIVAVSFFFIGSLSTSLFLCLFASYTKRPPAPIKPPYINRTVLHQIPVSLYDPTQPFKVPEIL